METVKKKSRHFFLYLHLTWHRPTQAPYPFLSGRLHSLNTQHKICSLELKKDIERSREEMRTGVFIMSMKDLLPWAFCFPSVHSKSSLHRLFQCYYLCVNIKGFEILRIKEAPKEENVHHRNIEFSDSPICPDHTRNYPTSIVTDVIALTMKLTYAFWIK